jgi:hypothetical protein
MKGIHAIVSGSTRDKTSPDTNQQSKIIRLSSNVNIIRNLMQLKNTKENIYFSYIYLSDNFCNINVYSHSILK